MPDKSNFKKWSEFDKTSKVIIKILFAYVCFLLVFKLLDALLLILTNGLLYIIAPLIPLTLLSLVIYYVRKQETRGLTIAIILGILSLRSAIEGVTDTRGISFYLAVFNLIAVAFLIIGPLVVLARNQKKKRTLWVVLKDLDTKQVKILGPALYFLLVVSIVLSIYDLFFVPYGIVRSQQVTLAHMVVNYFSIIPVLCGID